MPKLYWIFMAIVFVAGCKVLENNQTDQDSPPDPPITAAQNLRYNTEIRPIIEARCTVCHGCYDAPCQLKLDAAAGLMRGAHKSKVYDGARLLGGELTRLFEDGNNTADWRNKDFYPVINNEGAGLENNVLAQLLLLKQQNPQPATPVLPESFDLGINRNQQCPKPDQIADYREHYPLWGMPYGLPGLSQENHDTLIAWLEDGGYAAAPPYAPSPELVTEQARWERFFNGDDLKTQLVSRYLYEHLFLANLTFDTDPDHHFKLVRSKTPPGQPIDRIATRRPFDNPHVDRVYYRLWRDPSTALTKSNMVYRLNDNRMAKWQQWFFKGNYKVSELPTYELKVASNPFATFAELPIDGRYRFLLDEAEFTIMNFIKGPVCRGQVALNVIRDHFWVFFISPDALDTKSGADFLADNAHYLALPAEAGNTFRPLHHWRQYAKLQKDYMEVRADYVNQRIEQRPQLTLDVIWDGDGVNDNAALTIFRHNDSASVTRGLIGPKPKTSWVIDYTLLERIHYLLVAGFDVYGNVSHQLLSRLYMDFLRIEGEMNFVAFLPKDVQDQQLAHWYQGAEDDINDYLEHYLDRLSPLHVLEYQTDEPRDELLNRLNVQLDPALNASPYVRQLAWPDALRETFNGLQAIRGQAATLMPEVSHIWVPQDGVYSIIRTSAHSNVTSMLDESSRRRPENDQLVITKGIVGSHPNSFWLLNEADWPVFGKDVANLKTPEDYRILRARFGIGRTDPNFWEISDAIHSAYAEQQPQRAGLLDFNRLENR
ncbi:fatty acid cis/trans isomerase [Gilvimarinus sp. SDUM040013]|uniref:Fatty acid cis/trans isomerase n=1 Tax=Gilvimarinus gilvus TaxID=3058038 RepID=A0ABU4RY83_9GAMM|nr:fatty acid cis/trans isomerase [Gilvimarinus sp. SDUM040013]MDO3387364.1 fatty acid cis/trans isomerase [Gilvimarinus sp. SDUM040013]MDX6849841.1 fatty acid cis/trans isomerase [Gilvimarinus sp. SDUM040013]